MPRGRYSNLSVRREVREELDRLREELKINDLNDLLILLVKTYREHTSTISKLEGLLTNAVSKAVKEALQPLTNTISKVDELLTRASSTATSNASISTSGEAPATSNSSSLEPKRHATRSDKRTTAWDILKRDKVSCMSNIKARNPSRVIDALFEAGAIKIDLGRDVCVVYPEFWWRFWSALENLKTPNDEENVKAFKDERMKWLYTVLRREGIVVLDSTRKPPAWVYDAKRVEIPKSAMEQPEEAEEGELEAETLE
jgi:hypothetical protein